MKSIRFCQNIKLSKHISASSAAHQCAGAHSLGNTGLKNRNKWHSVDTFLKHIQNHHFSTSWTQKYHDWILILHLHYIPECKDKTKHM